MGPKRILKVATLVADHSVEGLARVRAIIEAVLEAKPLGFDGTEVVVGLAPHGERWWQEQARLLSEGLPRVSVRRLSWERVLADNVTRMFEPLGLPVSVDGIERATLPRDWGANFLDCGCWLVIGNVGIGGVYPARPTAVYCNDLAQRRIPWAYANSMQAPFWNDQISAFRLWRQSSAVVTSNPTTASDLVSYAGVAPEKVIELLSPLDCEPQIPMERLRRARDELLVRFEPDLRYACETVLCGLHLYQTEGGRLQPVLATEIPSEALGSKSNIDQIVGLPDQVRKVLEDARFERLTSFNDWSRLLAQHECVWLPREHGGDGLSLRRVLRSGARALCADTLVHRHAHSLVGGAAIFYKGSSASEIADALHTFERTRLSAPVHEPASTVMRGDLAREIGFVLDRLQEAAHA